MLSPDAVGSAASPAPLIGCGKQGVIYLIDRDNLKDLISITATISVQELGANKWSVEQLASRTVASITTGKQRFSSGSFRFNGVLLPLASQSPH